MDTKILEQVKTDEPALKQNLTYLTEHIGPRLTGSAKLDEASHGTAEQFKSAGLSNVHLEEWTIANSWTRGPASGRIIALTEQTLTLATAGWSPATKGPVRGPVVAVTFEKVEDLEQYKGKLKDAIVLLGRPRELQAPEVPLSTPWHEDTIPVARPTNEQTIDFATYRQVRLAAMKLFADQKNNAVLLPSEKQYGLLNMGALSREYQPSLVPVAYTTREDYEQLWRLQEQGRVEAEVNIEGSFSGKPVQVYNTVAEIRGTEKPDEVAIIGGHPDSPAVGAEATAHGHRAVPTPPRAPPGSTSGGEPKRNILLLLFTAEEAQLQ